MATKTKQKPRPKWDAIPTIPVDHVGAMSTAMVQKALGCVSDRKFLMMLQSGEFPRPDWKLGSLNRWNPRTVATWIAKQEEASRGLGQEAHA